MNCPLCNYEFYEDSLICPACHAPVKEMELTEKLENLSKKRETDVFVRFKSPAFLISIISLFLMLPFLLYMIITPYFDILENIPLFVLSFFLLFLVVCLIISLVKSIKLYASKTLNPTDISLSSMFAWCFHFLLIMILMLLGCFIGILLFDIISMINGGNGSGLLEWFGSEILLDLVILVAMAGKGTLVVIFNLIALFFLFMILISICFKKISDYHYTIFFSIQFSNHNWDIFPRKDAILKCTPPYVLAFICSGFIAVSGITLFFLPGNPVVVFLGGIFLLAISGYLITNAIVLKNIHMSLTASIDETDKAKSELVMVRAETAAVIANLKRLEFEQQLSVPPQ